MCNFSYDFLFKVFKVKEEQIKSLTRELATAEKARTDLEGGVERLDVYRLFLDSVVAQRPDIFPTIGVMMAR